MPKTHFSQALAAKQRERKLSFTTLAEEIGVSVASATAAVRGASVPNAKTLSKYAKFLGVDEPTLQGLIRGGGAPAGIKSAGPRKAPSKGPAKPGKSPAPRRSKIETDISDLTIGEIAAVFADPLAVAVSHASEDVRRIVARILGV